MSRRSARDEAIDVASAVVESTPADGPEPLARLRAALYETPEGGIVVAFRAEGMAADGHMVLKPALVKLIGRMSGVKGDPLALLRRGLVPDASALEAAAVEAAEAEESA